MHAWEHAWNNAQTTLSSIQDSLSSSISPDPRIIRVGQLDSELLDQELVVLLQEPLNKALTLVGVRIFFPYATIAFVVMTLYRLRSELGLSPSSHYSFS